MDQSTINKFALGIKIFGAIFGAIVLGILIWSLFRPAVKNGPPLPTPDPMSMPKDAAVG